MTRFVNALIGVGLVAASMLIGPPAVAADAEPNHAATHVMTSGRTPMQGISPNYTMSEGATTAVSCYVYWSEITKFTSVFGSVHWKWKHTADACYDGVVVTQWRQRFDQLTYTDGTAYIGSLVGDSVTPLPTAPASSYYQRRIDICVFYYGCYDSHAPWSKININGNGTSWVNWAVP